MRAVIFTDIPDPTVVALTRATIATARSRPAFEVCGLVTANPELVVRSRRAELGRLLRRVLVRGTGGPSGSVSDTSLARLAQREGLPFLIAERGVSTQAFIERLHRELAPDVILSYYCMQILKAPLLDSVEQAVNYHDGLLPHYAGLAATAHSIYRGESHSGFTFHRMTTGIDAGAILYQGSVPVDEDDDSRSVGRAKTVAAVAALPTVIDMIEAGDPGVEQTGAGSYFNRDDYQRMRTVEGTADLPSEEFQRRLRAFGTLTITIGGSTEDVTEVAPARVGDRFAFPTADGHLRATRLSGIPSGLIALWRRVRAVTGR
jgi:methionyl-tRNA formyltransferase